MASLEIYNSTATNYREFINKLNSFITNGGFMSISSSSPDLSLVTDVNKNSLNISYTTAVKEYFIFSAFNSKFCLLITAGLTSTKTYDIHCIPVYAYSTTTPLAFYNDSDKPSTHLKFSESDTAVFSNFRAVKYSDTKTQFLSLGRPSESMTISTHIFKSIDDPTITKTVFVVTDYDGYVSLYDSYNAYPWYIENVYHNGNNVGFTNSINAYKYTIKGYYCDNLYYFDGAYTMPGEGVSTMGGIKFLKLGNSNLFIKME